MKQAGFPTFPNEESVKSRGEVGITDGLPHTRADALAALQPAPGGPNTGRSLFAEADHGHERSMK